MFYKSFFEFSIDDSFFIETLNLSTKISFDGKTELQFKEINFFPNLLETLNSIVNFEESTDLANSLSELDNFCYLDDFRPDPNQLLYQTPIFHSICQIIYITNNKNILFLCLHILVHLSLADFNPENQILDSELIQKIVYFIEPDLSEINPNSDNQIHEFINQAILDFLLNISLSQSLETNFFDKIIIIKLSQICASKNSSKVQIISYQIASNFARLFYENDFIEELALFECIIQSAIASLKPGSSQQYAIELLSYLLFNKNCCEFALNFDIIDKLKDSLKSRLPISSIPNVFTAINSLIENCDLIKQFVDDFLIEKTMNMISQIDYNENQPLFIYIDSLCDNYTNFLENHGTIKFLCDLVSDSPLLVKKKSVFILAHLIDRNWMIQPMPKWIDKAIILVIENIHSLSIKKVEVVLLVLIEIHDFNEPYFFNIISKTDFKTCLDDINEMEVNSDTVSKYTDYLYNIIFVKDQYIGQ